MREAVSVRSAASLSTPARPKLVKIQAASRDKDFRGSNGFGERTYIFSMKVCHKFDEAFAKSTRASVEGRLLYTWTAAVKKVEAARKISLPSKGVLDENVAVLCKKWSTDDLNVSLLGAWMTDVMAEMFHFAVELYTIKADST